MNLLTLLLIIFIININLYAFQWTSIAVSVTNNINALDFIDDSHGWIALDSGSLVKTHDGGVTWNAISNDLVGHKINSLKFTGEKMGWAGGSMNDQATIWKTDNGGQSWSIQRQWPIFNSDYVGSIVGLHFVDSSLGWAVGSEGGRTLVVKTLDGGKTWVNIEYFSKLSEFAHFVVFSEYNLGWIMIQDKLFKTSDAGRHWNRVRYPGFRASDLAISDSRSAWISVGWDLLAFTDNFGESWKTTRVLHKESTHMYGVVYFYTKYNGLAINTNGEMCVTYNGGKSWTTDRLPRELVANGLHVDRMISTNSMLFVIANPGYLFRKKIRSNYH